MKPHPQAPGVMDAGELPVASPRRRPWNKMRGFAASLKPQLQYYAAKQRDESRPCKQRIAGFIARASDASCGVSSSHRRAVAKPAARSQPLAPMHTVVLRRLPARTGWNTCAEAATIRRSSGAVPTSVI
jgi:hypothetical protein